MRVRRFPSAADFHARAGSWLEAAEAENNLILGAVVALDVADTLPPGVLLASVEDTAGRILGCAFRTPPHKMALTGMPEDAARALADRAAEWDPGLPGVLGPDDAAAAFAARWSEVTGGLSTPAMKLRVHRLETVRPPEGVPGRLRGGREDDLALVGGWAEAFGRETGLSAGDAEAAAAGWLSERAVFLWEDDGHPVCMAVASGRTAHGMRVGYVYTPPERRGRGYASACVAELSTRALKTGLAFLVLYTDLANPTSNAIYRRIGYRPLVDVTDYDFQDLDTRVKLHIYRTLAETTTPPDVSATAVALGVREAAVRSAYHRLEEKRVLHLDAATARVDMAPPFSGADRGHRVVVEERTYFANCCWDAFGILAALHADGVVHTRCAQSGDPLTFRVEGGELSGDEAVAHFAVPASRWWEDIEFT